jgi:6-phosphogluconolactonase
MNPIEICVYDSDEMIAQAAARRWLATLRTAPSPVRCTALSGGRSARLLFKAITILARSASKPGMLAGVHFFWADERCVSPQDGESNYHLAHELLLAPLGIPDKRVHRIKGEIPPAEAVREAGQDLLRTVHAQQHGTPIIDLVFLGVGEDGHIASVFPDAPSSVLEGPEIYAAVIGPKPPPQRITLTLPVLAAARHVWVLACGSGKSEMIDHSLDGTRQTPLTPLARLVALRAHTVVFRKTAGH